MYICVTRHNFCESKTHTCTCKWKAKIAWESYHTSNTYMYNVTYHIQVQVCRNFWGLNISWIGDKFSWFNAPTKIYYPRKFRCHWNKTVVVKATPMEYEEELVCVSKPGNTHNGYTMAVGRNGTVKGHLLQKVACTCTNTVQYLYSISEESGHIHCRVTGR